MESTFASLSKILARQNQTAAALLAAAREHNLALRRSDAGAILATASKQEELSLQLEDQDREREEIRGKLAAAYGLDKQPALSQLLPYASEMAAAELKEFSRSFKEILTQLGEIKDLNNMLARRGKFITEQLLRALRPKNGGAYLESGKIEDHGKPLPIMDKTI